MNQVVDNDKMTVIEHLEELRKRIILSLIFLFCGTLLGLIVAKDVVKLLTFPVRDMIDKFVFIRPTEGISLYIKISLYCGLIFSFPFISYQIYIYLKPAFTDVFKISIIRWVIIITSLFITGTIFAFKIILPFAVKFLINFSSEFANPSLTIESYISFVLMILILSGLVFEMPVAVAFLTNTGILTPSIMKARRKEAIFAMVVISAVITPTTDIFNLILFFLPMAVLYEISILVSVLVYRRMYSEYGYLNKKIVNIKDAR